MNEQRTEKTDGHIYPGRVRGRQSGNPRQLGIISGARTDKDGDRCPVTKTG